jgi:L-arabinokinase
LSETSATPAGPAPSLSEAGEILYASHWSYSQRCGLGSLDADALVAEIRSRGPARGLFGAKITGMGCGGAVAVLMARTPQARDALQEACEAFSRRIGRPATLLTGSSPGAKFFGARPFES